ncbi:hypothetical protein QVD17_08053 [Tagetes erecta]|uniref:Reverse transcriptase zinc-binding domain-containing protein n=1 Tax=Tagetes erecta TaxID=13708 RepID=A0AAD8L440_TARER|nr:hypothetical protein QVD17_08053 [Tagetes erecta]
MQGTIHQWKWRWKRHVKWRWKRHVLDLTETQQLQQCINYLKQIHISSGKDQWQWTRDSTGIFTVSSMKAALTSTPARNNFILQWNGWVPIKVNIFGWRAEKERITTSLALSSRGVHLESHACPLCGDYMETTEHLLVSCSVARLVWQFISSWCHIPPLYVFSVKDLLEAHKSINGLTIKKKAIQAIVLTACWKIWVTRNEKVFDGKSVNITKLMQDIKSLGFLWVKNRSSRHGISWTDWCDMSL